MTGHVCDPSTDPDDKPLSKLRGILLLAALFDNHNQLAIDAINEQIGDCPKCLREILRWQSALFVALMKPHRSDLLMQFEMSAAAADADLRRRAGGG